MWYYTRSPHLGTELRYSLSQRKCEKKGIKPADSHLSPGIIPLILLSSYTLELVPTHTDGTFLPPRAHSVSSQPSLRSARPLWPTSMAVRPRKDTLWAVWSDSTRDGRSFWSPSSCHPPTHSVFPFPKLSDPYLWLQRPPLRIFTPKENADKSRRSNLIRLLCSKKSPRKKTKKEELGGKRDHHLPIDSYPEYLRNTCHDLSNTTQKMGKKFLTAISPKQVNE